MNARSHSFVTGTDTEIGKTLVSAAFLHAFAQQGLRAAAMKPIAAGAFERDGVLAQRGRGSTRRRRQRAVAARDPHAVSC